MLLRMWKYVYTMNKFEAVDGLSVSKSSFVPRERKFVNLSVNACWTQTEGTPRMIHNLKIITYVRDDIQNMYETYIFR